MLYNPITISFALLQDKSEWLSSSDSSSWEAAIGYPLFYYLRPEGVVSK
jgi:hypothetical protein